MKIQITIVTICVCFISVSSENNFSNNLREPKLFSGLFSGLGSLGHYNRCGHCPEHHCRLDETVLLGYCCGCKRVTDQAPIRCPYHLDCPPTPQPLCSEYDYMMDCCC